jgi:hypothetical protein
VFSLILEVIKMDETLLARRSELRRKLFPLEWDMRLKQINEARALELKSYRSELETIEKQIEGDNNGKVL